MPKFSPARLVGACLNGLAVVAPRWAGMLSFYLFGLPKRDTPKEQEAEFLATADLKFLHINGRKIALYRWGADGPVALLAHGWESQAGRWRKLAPLLAQAGFQVLAVDAPAHGRSQGRHFTMLKYADVLAAVARQFGPVELMIGHSVGGAAVIWTMGLLQPDERPRRAVVLAAFSELQTIMDDAQRFIGASARLMRAVDAYIVERTGADIKHYSLNRIAGTLGAVDALLMHDRADRVTPFHESERLHAAWPGSQFIPTKGMGHGLTAPFIWEKVLEFATAAQTEKQA